MSSCGGSGLYYQAHRRASSTGHCNQAYRRARVGQAYGSGYCSELTGELSWAKMMAQVTVNMVTRELRYAKLTAQATVANSQESSAGPR
jgi:hypothetical protein